MAQIIDHLLVIVRRKDHPEIPEKAQTKEYKAKAAGTAVMGNILNIVLLEPEGEIIVIPLAEIYEVHVKTIFNNLTR